MAKTFLSEQAVPSPGINVNKVTKSTMGGQAFPEVTSFMVDNCLDVEDNNGLPGLDDSMTEEEKDSIKANRHYSQEKQCTEQWCRVT